MGIEIIVAGVITGEMVVVMEATEITTVAIVIAAIAVSIIPIIPVVGEEEVTEIEVMFPISANRDTRKIMT